jgi:hypothetical protein
MVAEGGQVMKQYKTGDCVWVAVAGVQQVSKECPVCFGKLSVTLTLGNGDGVVLPCQMCAPGYEPPRGFVLEYEYVAQAEVETIREVRTASDADGDRVEYLTFSSHLLKHGEAFDTQEEAMVSATEKSIRYAEEQRTRAEYLKGNQAKSYSWNAGYHMREAKRKEEDAARHRERAQLCKAKGKTEEGK